MRTSISMFGVALAAVIAAAGHSQAPAVIGPYNVVAIAGGDSLVKASPALATVTPGPWTMRFWVKPDASSRRARRGR